MAPQGTRRVRALYRLGELTAAEDDGAPSGGPAEDRPDLSPMDRPALECGPSDPPTGGPSAEPPRTRKRTARRSSAGRAAGPSARRSRKTTATPPDVEDLMPLGRRIAADLAATGQSLTRNALAVRLREAGQTAGNARVGALLARLKTEPADPPTANPNAAEDTADAAAATAEGDTQ